MSNQRSKMVIVCEDSQHRVFVYRLLKAFGLHRRIRIEVAQEGRGAADQWVRQRYPEEVAAYRRATMSVGLITVIDADENTVRSRRQELNDVLVSNGLDRRKSEERICLLIPKRNIETWIYALRGKDVNETDTYRKLDKESECQPAVDQLVRFIRNDCPKQLISSLRRGCRELSTRLPE